MLDLVAVADFARAAVASSCLEVVAAYPVVALVYLEAFQDTVVASDPYLVDLGA